MRRAPGLAARLLAARLLAARLLAARLLAAQLLVIGAGTVTFALVSLAAGLPLFRVHLRRALGTVPPGVAAHLQDAFATAAGVAIGVGTAAALLTAAAVSVLIARRLSWPIRALGQAAARLADGDYTARIGPAGLGPELDQLTGAFNTMAAALEATEATRRRLIADVAHELRTPLATLDAFLGPEHLPHIFERFYRADTARDQARGGSGIGLTIARALITAHGGTLTAASDGPGTGARFTITLPGRPHSADGPAHGQDGRPRSRAPRQPEAPGRAEAASSERHGSGRVFSGRARQCEDIQDENTADSPPLFRAALTRTGEADDKPPGAHRGHPPASARPPGRKTRPRHPASPAREHHRG